MASNKIDMSLDDIIKISGIGRGRGRGGRFVRGARGARGRGGLRVRGLGVTTRGNRRGAAVGFRSRGRSRFGFGGRGRGRGVGGVLRGGVQKRRGFQQTSFAKVSRAV